MEARRFLNDMPMTLCKLKDPNDCKRSKRCRPDADDNNQWSLVVGKAIIMKKLEEGEGLETSGNNYSCLSSAD